MNKIITKLTDTFVEEPEVDIAKAQKEIIEIEKELTEVQNEMKKYLADLIN